MTMLLRITWLEVKSKFTKLEVRTCLGENKDTTIESDVNEFEMVESADENKDGEVKTSDMEAKVFCFPSASAST